MNPDLVESIRLRMREQPTEKLLALWTTNDRVMWSPEAFEAVRSLLVERGVGELPPQNDPAPIAVPYSAVTDPVAEYWMGWLRPVLWIGCGVACAALATQAAQVTATWERLSLGGGNWRDLAPVLVTLVFPVLLLVGCIGCLRRVPAARVVLLVFAWVALVAGCISAVRSAAWSFDGLFSVAERAEYVLSTLLSHVHALVLPAVLLILLRRPEIRSAFVPFSHGKAFEPVMDEATSKPAPQ